MGVRGRQRCTSQKKGGGGENKKLVTINMLLHITIHHITLPAYFLTPVTSATLNKTAIWL